MAKALMGHLPTDGRALDRMSVENAKLRARVAELTDLVDALKLENDLLVARVSDLVESNLDQMQPA